MAIDIVAEIKRIAEDILAADPIQGLGDAGLLPEQHLSIEKGQKGTRYDRIRRVKENSGGYTEEESADIMEKWFPASKYNSELHTKKNDSTAVQRETANQDRLEREALFFTEADQEYQIAFYDLQGELSEFAKMAKEMSVYLEQELQTYHVLDNEISEFPKWLEDEGHDIREAAGVKRAFDEMAKYLNYYLAFIKFNAEKSKQIVLLIDDVAVRFNQTKSDAVPGVWQTMAGFLTEKDANGNTVMGLDGQPVKLDVDDELRKIPSQVNSDPKLKAEIARKFADKIKQRIARIEAANEQIHNLRLANIEAGIKTKEYLKNFEILIRQKNGELVAYTARVLGMGYQRREYSVPKESPLEKTSSARMAGLGDALGKVWDKIKEKVSQAVSAVKSAWDKIKGVFSTQKQLHAENMAMINGLNNLADELEEDISI